MELVKLFFSFGIGGAILWVLYHFGNKLFDYITKKQDSDIKSSNKLVDRLDCLIATIHGLTDKITESVTTTVKQNSEINSKLDQVLEHQVYARDKLCILVERRNNKK